MNYSSVFAPVPPPKTSADLRMDALEASIASIEALITSIERSHAELVLTISNSRNRELAVDSEVERLRKQVADENRAIVALERLK